MPTIGNGRITSGTGQVTYEGTTSGSSSTGTETTTAKPSVKSVTGHNLGVGYGLFMGTNGSSDVVLDFKSVVAGDGIVLSEDGSTITIKAVGGLDTINFSSIVEAPASIIPKGILYGVSEDELDFITAPSSANVVLKWNGTSFEWTPETSGTVTSVGATGQNGVVVSGSPITQSGSLSIGLSSTGVTPGTYTAPTVTIDAQGRVTSASTNTLGEINTGANVGSGVGVYSTKNGTALEFKTLKGSGNTTITSTANEVTVSTTGVTEVAAQGSHGVSVTGGPITDTGTLAIRLTDTGVTAGSYTNANVTVDAQGRLISVTNGSAGVSSVGLTGSDGVVVTGSTITGSGSFNVALGTSGVTAGTYVAPTIVVDNKGRVTSAAPNPIVTAGENLSESDDGSANIFFGKSGQNLQFRRIVGTGGIDVTESESDVIIDASGILENQFSGLTVLEEGTQVGTDVKNLNIVGDALTVTESNGTATITLNGATGTVKSVTATGQNGVTVSGGPITTTGNFAIGLSATGVTSGTYHYPSVTVDSYGRVTAMQSNTISNVGSGATVYRTGTTPYQLRSIVAGDNIEITQDVTEIVISTPASVSSVGVTGTNGITVSGDTTITDSGSFNVSLSSTGVTPGTYNSLTVNAQGRVTAATVQPIGEANTASNVGTGGFGTYYQKSGTNLQFKSLVPGSGIGISDNGTTLTISAPSLGHTTTITAGAGMDVSSVDEDNDTNFTVALDQSGVTAGTYNIPTVTVDQYGRITEIVENPLDSGEVNVGVNDGSGVGVFKNKVNAELHFKSLLGGDVIELTETTNSIEIDAKTTGVTAGSYDIASITVDDYGRITYAASGPSPVYSVDAEGAGGISVTGGPITNTGTFTVTLDDTAVTPGTYNKVSVNQQGRVISATNVVYGDISNGRNLGDGTGIYAGKELDELQFKSIVAGDNITVTEDSETGEITITSTATVTGVGEVNTASNVSGGVGVFYQKTDADLEFKSLTGGDGVTITESNGVILIDALAGSATGTVTSVAATGSNGITVVGSPITESGTLSIGLANTGVTAGTYNRLTVNAQGRVTAATLVDYGTVHSVAASGYNGIEIAGSPITDTGEIEISLSETGVEAGTYNSVTVDPYGRITDATNENYGEINTASNVGTGAGIFKAKADVDLQFKSLVAGENITLVEGTNTITIDASGLAGTGTVTSVDAAGTSDVSVTGGPVTTEGTFIIGLTDTGVTGGTYNNVTVDAKGRVTAASNVSYLTANQTTTLSGDITGSGTTSIITSLSETGVTSGSYTNANVTVDSKGRITEISNGTGGSGGIAVQDEGTEVVSLADTLNFVGNGVTVTDEDGVTTVTVPGGSSNVEQNEFVVFRYSSGAGGTFDVADPVLTTSSGVEVNILDASNCIVEFNFTGHAFPPIAIAVMGHVTATNELVYTNVTTSFDTRKVLAGGTWDNTTYMGNFSRFTIQLRMMDTGAGAGFQQRAQCAIMFKF